MRPGLAGVRAGYGTVRVPGLESRLKSEFALMRDEAGMI